MFWVYFFGGLTIAGVVGWFCDPYLSGRYDKNGDTKEYGKNFMSVEAFVLILILVVLLVARR